MKVEITRSDPGFLSKVDALWRDVRRRLLKADPSSVCEFTKGEGGFSFIVRETIATDNGPKPERLTNVRDGRGEQPPKVPAVPKAA